MKTGCRWKLEAECTIVLIERKLLQNLKAQRKCESEDKDDDHCFSN